jgi:hypothetical protein
MVDLMLAVRGDDWKSAAVEAAGAEICSPDVSLREFVQ